MLSSELGNRYAATRVHHAGRGHRGGLVACGARAAPARSREVGLLHPGESTNRPGEGFGCRRCLETIMRGEVMKIVVIGGTGLIGSKVVEKLKQKGHEAIAAAPNTGVNTITGEGLKEAMAGAQVVIDLANSPSFEDKAALEFFETSGRNLLAAEAAAGVRHHVALSIVGTDRTPDNGYFRAKAAQEKLIETSRIPYTLIPPPPFPAFLPTLPPPTP